MGILRTDVVFGRHPRLLSCAAFVVFCALPLPPFASRFPARAHRSMFPVRKFANFGGCARREAGLKYGLQLNTLKPMRRKSSHHKRSQRAGVAGNPVEMLVGKWFAEGKGKGRKTEYPDREPALEAGQCWLFVRGFLTRTKQRWHRRYSKPVLWNPKGFEGQAFLIA